MISGSRVYNPRKSRVSHKTGFGNKQCTFSFDLLEVCRTVAFPVARHSAMVTFVSTLVYLCSVLAFRSRLLLVTAGFLLFLDTRGGRLRFSKVSLSVPLFAFKQ